jgi:hypothetical protein
MSVVIDIAAQFTGKKAFSAAENAADKLGRSVKHALIGVGVTAFAKSAIQAFAENEKQLATFKNSLRTIGFEFATSDSLAFLNSLKLQYGVADSQLIPAYQQLLTTTRSLGASQNLTNIAMDIAARQGISVTEAADALSKAYLGNTKSVSALGLGISKATLASGNFAQILKEITNVTKGSAAAAADTFAGKLSRIKVAADTAKESIGAGLVEALMQITKSTDIDQLQTKIINFGESAAATLKSIGKIISDNIGLIKIFGGLLISAFAISKVAAFVESLMTLNKAMKALRNSALAAAIAEMFMLNPLGGAAMAVGMLAVIAGIIKSVDLLTQKTDEATDKLKILAQGTATLGVGGDQGGAAKFTEGAAARAAKDAKDAAAAQLKATKAQTKAVKDQTLLKKSQGILDVAQAEILFALQGKISDNERLRLELQLALLTNNAKEADRLSNELLISQGRLTGLATYIANLPKALNPFADYPYYVQKALEELAKLAEAQKNLTFWQQVRAQSNAINASMTQVTAANAAQVLSSNPIALNEYQAITGEMSALGVKNTGGIYITVNNAGSVVSDADLADQLRNSLLNSNLSGSPSAIGRLKGAFQ